MAVLPSGIWQGWKTGFGGSVAWTVDMEFGPPGSVSGRREDTGGEFEIRGSYLPITARSSAEVECVVWLEDPADRVKSIEFHANLVDLEEDDTNVPQFRRVRFCGSWRHPQTGVQGTFELWSTNVAPEPILRPIVPFKWGVSRFNSAYCVTVTNVSHDIRGDGISSDVSLTFVACGDGSLGALQDPLHSVLCWDGRHVKRPWHCAFLVNSLDLIVGTLFFEAIPADVEIGFAYWEKRNSTTILRDPRLDTTGDLGECGDQEVNLVATTQKLEEAERLKVEIGNKVREVADLRTRLRQLRGGGGAGAADGNAESGSGAPVLGGVDEDMCIACVNAPRNSVLLWCGHQVLCLQCAGEVHRRMAVCPVCRSQISKVQRVRGT